MGEEQEEARQQRIRHLLTELDILEDRITVIENEIMALSGAYR